MSKYSATFIYKISCKNPNILDFYIGHTTSFACRMRQHKNKSLTEDEKLYTTIRENGGWENWHMEIVEHYSCKSLSEARKREQYWMNELNSTLNERYSFQDNERDRRLNYYRANQTVILEKKKIHRQKPEVKNRESEIAKIWRKNNKEKCKELKQQWEENNKEHIAEYNKKRSEKIKTEYILKKDEFNYNRRLRYALINELKFYNI